MISEESDAENGANGVRRVSGGASVTGTRNRYSAEGLLFQWGWVYFIGHREAGPVKIGWTLTPAVRVRTIQVACPFDVELLGAFHGQLADEKRLHERFRASRLRPNGEWFHRTDELGLLVMCLQANVDMRMDPEFDWALKRERYR